MQGCVVNNCPADQESNLVSLLQVHTALKSLNKILKHHASGLSMIPVQERRPKQTLNSLNRL